MNLHDQPDPGSDPGDRDAFCLRVEQYLDNALDASQIDSMSQELAGDEQKLQLFQSLSMQHQMLRNHHRHMEVSISASELTDCDHEVADTFDDGDVLALVIAEAIEQRRIKEVRALADRMLDEDRRGRRRKPAAKQQANRHVTFVIPRVVVGLGLVAAICLAALLAVHFGSPASNTPKQNAVAPATRPLAPAVASIHDAYHAVWADGTRPVVGTELAEGDTIRLGAGFIELKMASGVVVVLEGPCELGLTGENRLRLEQGKLVAEVPAQAMFFTVDTPSARVVDFGTEFGVHVDRVGKTDALVFTGEIELAEMEPEATPGATPQSKRSVRLVAGWRSSVTPDGDLQESIKAVGQQMQTAFARSIQEAADPAFQYRRSVMAGAPTAYWGFESDFGAGVENLADPSGHRLRAVGSPRLVEDGVIGSAASLNMGGSTGSCFVTDQPQVGMGERDDFSVELVFKAEHHHLGALINLHAGEVEDLKTVPSFFVLELQREKRAIVNDGWRQPDTLRALHRDPPGPRSEDDINLFSPRYEPGRWHHVAFVKADDQLHLYFDGERVATSKSTSPEVNKVYAIIGALAKQRLLGQDPESQFYSGLIDEIAIYDRAITEEEIAFRSGIITN